MSPRNIIYVAAASLIFVGAGCASSAPMDGSAAFERAASPKDASYAIDGTAVRMGQGGVAYFGNEAVGDVDGDGDADTAFLFTTDAGGSGTFFYVAVALKTDAGYVGTEAILLGDRIAPQPTVFMDGAIIVNYADRKADEPMTARPSQGVSRWFTVSGGKLVETPQR